MVVTSEGSLGQGRMSAGVTSDSRLIDREDSLGIAVLSSACVSAARRLIAGQAIEETDRLALERAAGLFRGALDGLRFIESNGKQGRPPSQLQYSGFAVQLLSENRNILSHGTNGQSTGQDIAGELETWLHRIEEFASTGKESDASGFADFFLALTELSRAEAGSTGDIASPAIPT
jgi:hypothetical protein